jgi:hypothetical protein
MVAPERISDAENVRWRVPVEADSDVKVNLLGISDPITPARVEELTGPAGNRELAYILGEEKCAARRAGAR